MRCHKLVAYSVSAAAMVTLVAAGDAWEIKSQNKLVKHCANREGYDVCNIVLDISDTHALCSVCRLNRTIPDLAKPENRLRWSKLEQAKRRLLIGLMDLHLPLEAPVRGYSRGLCFDFLEDQRSNSDVAQKFITTGHRDGVITINILEADDVQRVWQREHVGERYRTLLGHMRHEVGHYYFELIVSDREGFGQIFGDVDTAYEKALKNYYARGPLPGWEQSHISAYASAHPAEDWAECFAHYLHMADTLETATAHRLIEQFSEQGDFEQLLLLWDRFSASLNEVNRSLGLSDAYPFVITPIVKNKLRFIHSAIARYVGLQL